MHLPVDRVADFRDWQTKLILETGEVLHQDEWRGQLLALSSEPPEKAVAIAILAAAEDGDGEKVRGLLEQLPLLVAGNVTDRVYVWLNGRLVRELIESELPPPATPEPVEEVSEIDRLDQQTPSLDKDSSDWVVAADAADIDDVQTQTLRAYRLRGIKNAHGTFGIDKDGRKWRQLPGPHRGGRVYYLRSTLKCVS